MTKWFKRAVTARPPNSLGGWSKGLPPAVRRRRALASRPSNWRLSTRRLSAGRALMALANVTRDKQTREVAARDARHFFSLLKRR